ncbi:MAG: deoxynucleoside kinase [Gammaproteobacteria bacterium]|nr:deoxynucleoside kinase [Gammaproteobacteria bacterium]MDH4315140.1 deoxynucleoside kinase [Gammaproteobacteria bacterium]MDH5214237.1 deoxynucleoside kinase [Gammaproteobacteria bacterium]MDH5501711.1 deoxynucleoside kinase [Gammaproteobacteria bacterium]
MGITNSNDLKRTPRFIVVEGPIGVGKTSLARRLATSLSGEVVLEQVDENPFLERFYRSGRNAALPAQLFFLFQRARQIEELRQSDLFATVRVADFHLAKDRLFAELNLDRQELELYDKISANLDVEPPVPDLVVYLQASVDALLGRIARRGIPYERMIDRRYLERLTEAYARYFHHYDEGPLLIVNASSIDPIHNEADYDALLQQILTTRGRSFFNPAAEISLA